MALEQAAMHDNDLVGIKEAHQRNCVYCATAQGALKEPCSTARLIAEIDRLRSSTAKSAVEVTDAMLDAARRELANWALKVHDEALTAVLSAALTSTTAEAAEHDDEFCECGSETCPNPPAAAPPRTSRPSVTAEPDVVEAQTHNLVIEHGDCEFYATCSCGKELGMSKPDQSFDVLALLWERHVMTEVPA